MTVDILCKVVDNLGDIGFVYRLARALSELPEAPRLRLIVDDLASFSLLCPAVDPSRSLQTVEGWLVARWDDPGEESLRRYRDDRPRMVLECYACGRPEWLESILFDESDPVPRHVINLEYLTAEPWARDFHRLPSLTRSPLVRKAVFMPGLEPGTGGLLIDNVFSALLDSCATDDGRLSIRRAALDSLEAIGESIPPEKCAIDKTPDAQSLASAFWFLVFSYEHDFSGIVADMADFNARKPILALVAAGRSSVPFLEAWARAGRPFPVFLLPLVPQPLWDRLLVASDFAIVRGEESFARAILAGNPFLWQCYPFAETVGAEADSTLPVTQISPGGQLPKVHAFLDRMQAFLSPQDFAAYDRLTRAFNGEALVEPERGDLLAVLRSLEKRVPPVSGEFPPKNGLAAGFRAWSREVRNLGNLAANLMTFMRDLG